MTRLRLRAPQNHFKPFFVAVVEFVEEDDAALSQDWKHLWVEPLVSLSDDVFGGTLAWAREDCLFFHYKADGVVVNRTEQNRGLAHGEAILNQCGRDALDSPHVCSVGQARSRYHASTVAIAEQRFAKTGAERRRPQGPVAGASPREHVVCSISEDDGSHLIEEFFLAFEVPVEGGSLDLKLAAKQPKSQSLQADLIEEGQRGPSHHIAIDLHAFSVAVLTVGNQTSFNNSNSVKVVQPIVCHGWNNRRNINESSGHRSSGPIAGVRRFSRAHGQRGV